MRKKIDFGLLTQHQEKGSEIIRLAKLAESLGFGTYWVPEDPYYRGSFVTAGTIAAHTTTMRISTSVINPFLRHPVAIAQEWAALDDYSEGRAMLGIASGGAFFLRDQLNLPWKKPLTAVRETVDIFEQLIAGETANYDGEIFQVSSLKQSTVHGSQVKLSIPPFRSKIPIHVGASGPKLLQYCGERLDGLIMPGLRSVSDASLSYTKENLGIGAARSGRDVNDIDISWLMTLSISENDQEAREHIKPFIAAYLVDVFDSGGGDILESRDGLAVSYLEQLSNYAKAGGNPADLITDDILDDYTVSGCPERCKEQIARLIEKGINSFVLVDFTNYGRKYGGVTFDVESMMKLLSEKVMPEFL